MVTSNSDRQLFKVIVKSNPSAKKVLFYMSSYKFRWWIYVIPVLRFRSLGYEVAVYDFDDEILESSDPKTLPTATQSIINDVANRQAKYKQNNIKIFHGIGNSLGGYMLFNCAVRLPFSAIVLNGIGSMAGLIFGYDTNILKHTVEQYHLSNIDHQKLLKLWTEFDSPNQGKYIKAEKILITHTINDKVIPPEGTKDFIKAIKSSGKSVDVKTDSSSHQVSTMRNSHKIKQLNDFLNT